MKHFSLSSNPRTLCYDNLIIPLLQRMINLEKLTLFLSIIRINSNYIDGIQLHDDILSYMPQLNKFSFGIETAIVKTKNDFVLSSNEDIQRSFIGRKVGPVGSCVDIFAVESGSQSHAYSSSHEFYSRSKIYTLPYPFRYYSFLSNSFQNGTFERVQTLSMSDMGTFERVQTLSMSDMGPFEHELFQIVSRSFPLLCNLHIFNDKGQKSKQESRSLITFPHLLRLDLDCAHVDYAEQFLIDQYCHLPSLFKLQISYVSLMSVTNNFTHRATRLVCSKLKNLCTREPFVPPEHFHRYFSSL